MPSRVVGLKRAISGSCAAPAASLPAAAAASSQTSRSATERFICSRAAIPRQPTLPVQNGGYRATATVRYRRAARLAIADVSNTSATSHHHPAAIQGVSADQRGGQPAQGLQFLGKGPVDGLYRCVGRAGWRVIPDVYASDYAAPHGTTA